MIFDCLIEGVKIGFTVAVPVGPIALLVMRRASTEGRIVGLASGIGAALADLICGTVSVLCLSALTTLKETHHHLLQLGGGCFMVVMGFYTMRAKAPGEVKETKRNRNLFSACISTCALTIANPLTLVGLVGVTAASGIGMQDLSATEITVLVGSIFLGSSLWWAMLSSSASWLGRKLGPNLFHVLNMIAGAAIGLFGLWQLLSLAHHIWKF